MKIAQLWVSAILMLVTACVLHVRGSSDYIPPSTPLAQLPLEVDGLLARDIPLDQSVLDVLGKGIFLNRLYEPTSQTNSANQLPVELFIGYFPTQRTGQSIHSPQHCLPGAGWVFDSAGTATLSPQGEAPITVSDYRLSNGEAKAEVLYWYRSHGRSVASDYAAKLYTLADSLRYGRTDAALVRVIAPIDPHGDPLAAHNRLVSFATRLNSLLPPYIPN